MISWSFYSTTQMPPNWCMIDLWERYHLVYFGGVAVVVSDDMLQAILGALLALVGLIEKLISLVHAVG